MARRRYVEICKGKHVYNQSTVGHLAQTMSH